jgi:hypothetical protein
MTVTGAPELVRPVGMVQGREGVLRLRFPERERVMLQAAIDALRAGEAQALNSAGSGWAHSV